MSVLLRAGMDEQRVIDGEGWTLERYAHHIARLTALKSDTARPLVVLTRTTPLALAVTQTRRVLEEAVPELERAPWLIYHDPALDPFFQSAVEAAGVLDVDMEGAPIWVQDRHRYLILGPYERQLDIVPARIAAMDLLEVPISGSRIISRRPHSTGSMRAVNGDDHGDGK